MVWKSIAYDTFEGVMAVEEVIAKWSNDRIQFKSYDAKLKKTNQDKKLLMLNPAENFAENLYFFRSR